MVINTEVGAYVSSIEWAEEGVQLKEFAKKYPLPQIGRVIKGHFEGIGVPSLSCPSSRQIALWFNGGRVIKLAAQCVKFKESRGSGSTCRPVPFGPKLAIPDNYDGFFEILSEEGRSVRCIESVAELAKRFPENCLVRESIKVHISKSVDDVDVVSDKTRNLSIGETLTLIKCETSSPRSSRLSTTVTSSSSKSFLGQSSSSSGSSSSAVSSSSSPLSSTCSSTNSLNRQRHSADSGVSSSPQSLSPTSVNSQQLTTETVTVSTSTSVSRYLKCCTKKGETVYLPLEAKGKFSPIAKEESISGVHRISSLLSKRLPLMVRLVSGRPPSGFKSFVPEMRLFSVFSEDYLMALPINKESANVVTVPLSVSLKVIGPKNGDDLQTSTHHQILCNRFTEKTSGQSCNLLPNRIQVCDGSALCKEMKNNWKEIPSNVNNGTTVVSSSTTSVDQVKSYDHKKRLSLQSKSCDLLVKSLNNNNNSKSELAGGTPEVGPFPGKVTGLNSGGEANDDGDAVVKLDEDSASDGDDDDYGSCYDEIDQIYDYVRGFAPLPEKLRPKTTSSKSGRHYSSKPPEPPPIETIPTSYRRLSYPTIVHEFIPPMNNGFHCSEKMKHSSEHIYEKVPGSRPEKRYYEPNGIGGGHSYGGGPRIPMRSNSTGKMYIPVNSSGTGLELAGFPSHVAHNHSPHVHHHPHHHPLVKPKLFIKSNQPIGFVNGLTGNLVGGMKISPAPIKNGKTRGPSKTGKFMKYAKGLAFGNENQSHNNNIINNNNNNAINSSNNMNGYQSNSNNKWTCRSSRSLTTSPLFNIRYKSLTNLHFINPLVTSGSKGYDHSNNTLDSSNSGGEISSGSGGSLESPGDSKAKTRKLSRPLSFSNLFWDLKNDLLVSSNKCPVGDLIDPRISSLPSGGEYSLGHSIQNASNNNRRVGTLYL